MTVTSSDDAPAPLELDAARFLLDALGDGALWRWLSQRERAELRGEVTKSFKNAPASLRHGLVKTRFARHLQRHQKDLQALLKMWAPSQIELLGELRNLATSAARVLAADASEVSADEKPSDSAPADSDAAPFTAPLDYDFPDEITQPLRTRFGEHALPLAQLFLQSALPDDEIFAAIASHETASTRSEAETAAAIFDADETSTANAAGAGTASENATSVTTETTDESLASASTRDAPNESLAIESTINSKIGLKNGAPQNAALPDESSGNASTRKARSDAARDNLAPSEPETAAKNRAASTRNAPQLHSSNPQSNEAARATLGRQLEAAKAARDEHRQRARGLSTELETTKTSHQRELHELRAQLIQSGKDAATQREKSAAAQKALERETRRAKSENAQLETFEAENKSLKRQLRQSQQSAEDARKTVATATAQLQIVQGNNELLQREIEVTQSENARMESSASTREGAARGAKKIAKTPRVKAARVEIEAVKVAPIAPRVLDPLDEVFRWNAAAGDFAVTLRETREMISRNDETRVFALSRALEFLRENDEKTYLNFLARVREFGAYFRRVLTVSTTRVLVDASNVARIETDRRGRGQLDFLLQAREELRRRDAFPLLLIADASLQHFIDEPGEVAKMAQRGELELLPAGNVADDFLAREARRTGAFVLTNDKSFHKQVAPDFEPSRIGFKLHHHFIEIDDF